MQFEPLNHADAEYSISIVQKTICETKSRASPSIKALGKAPISHHFSAKNYFKSLVVIW